MFGARGGDASEGLLSIVEIAAIHEFGGGNVPSRSYLRAFVDENENALRVLMMRLLKAVIAHKYTKDQALELFAATCVGQIKARIAAGIAPELKPATKARKEKLSGSAKDTPLILTGQLRNSITYRISEPGKEIAFPAPEGAEAKPVAAKDAAQRRKQVGAERARAVTKAVKGVKRAVKKSTKKAIKGIAKKGKK